MQLRFRGFTLVEIMVVLAIVALITAFLLPALSRVRENGRSAQCQNQLKQMALAIHQYVQDYDGHFPGQVYVENSNTPQAKAFYWSEVIQPYLKNQDIFHCASSNSYREPNYSYNSLELNHLVWNDPRKQSGGIATADGLAGDHEAWILDISATWLTHDSFGSYDDGTKFNGADFDTACGHIELGTLHSGVANFSFVDGHVKWLSPTQQAETRCKLLYARH